MRPRAPRRVARAFASAVAALVAALLDPLPARAQFAAESPSLEVRRLDPRFDALVAPAARGEKIVRSVPRSRWMRNCAPSGRARRLAG